MSRGLHSARSLSATAIGVFAIQIAACSDGVVEPAVGAGAGGETAQSGSGGEVAEGGETNERGGSAGDGVVAGAGADGVAGAGSVDGAGGSSEAGGPNLGGAAQGGAAQGGAGGVPSGEGGSGATTLSFCVYDQDVPLGGAGGSGGEGGAEPEPEPNIIVRTDPFLGQYLSDAAGKTLYLYGKDHTGDCENAPVSNCSTASCLSAWPPFHVAERVLGDGLDESRFGSVQGPAGPITTYLGWPLYYYPSDTDAGMIKGQGKQGLWFAAEVEPPAIIPMRATDATVNHLATRDGWPLYVHALDTLGTEDSPPVSACTGECVARHVPLLTNHISVASAVESSDFSLFVRADSELQLAYKGAPLYLDAETVRPGVLVSPLPEQWGVALK
jgi:predicted lipoprotein with Yx(FWY)xxD motif